MASTIQKLTVNKAKMGMLLRAMRDFEGKTQRDVAIALGYPNATLVCNIEKGNSGIPMDKISDMATSYYPSESRMLSCAILKKLHPECWEAGMEAFAYLLGHKGDKRELANKVEEWIESQYRDFGIKF